MEKILIETNQSRSEILIGEKWENVNRLIPSEGVVIITDDNVNRLYGNKFPNVPVLSVAPGEESKKLEIIECLAGMMLERSVDRSGFILAIGGGVVCDIAGFLASIYMRGIRFGYVSTTLLSQVDASTGGKNGVDLGGTKNILGTFRQPEFVICDPEMLLTLSEDEYLSGLSELIKTAIIGNNSLFETVERNQSQILRRDIGLLTSIVSESVRFKAMVVSEDEKEKGLRKILNFGHTFGHAIEIDMSLRHGFAVAWGMKIAAEYSYTKGYISREECNRINDVLKKYNLIVHPDIKTGRMADLVRRDKKKTGEDIYFVFTKGIGKAAVEKISINEALDFYKRFIEKN